jgi:hypothetical protein
MQLADKPRPEGNPAPIVVTTPSKITSEIIDKKLTYLLNKTKCSEFSSSVNDQGNVTLNGFVGKNEDLVYIQSELAALGAKVSNNIEFRPWPQCEVLLTLRDFLIKPHDLQLKVSGGDRVTLNEGEQLVIEVTTPDYPSYLYLTYVQANGDAVHLVRPLGKPVKPVESNTHLVFGNGEKGRGKFTINAPFGDEILVAIASSIPLFDEELPKNQIERDYLTQFRQALLGRFKKNIPDRVISASIVTIVAKPKN